MDPREGFYAVVNVSADSGPAKFLTWAPEYSGHRLLGSRPKYKAAQRLCEQTAGRPLDWRSLGGGNYEGK